MAVLMPSVAVVNHAGDVLYHSYVFVHPSNVKDYRTACTFHRHAVYARWGSGMAAVADSSERYPAPRPGRRWVRHGPNMRARVK